MAALWKKLQYKNETAICVLHAPDTFASEVASLTELRSKAAPEAAPVLLKSAGRAKWEYLLAFVTSTTEIAALALLLETRLRPGASLWVAYPKASSKKYQPDFNRDSGWDALGALGYEPVSQVAIDVDWSALRFRKAELIPKFVRKGAISETGRTRIRSATKL
jgi:hypothetical protein